MMEHEIESWIFWRWLFLGSGSSKPLGVLGFRVSQRQGSGVSIDRCMILGSMYDGNPCSGNHHVILSTVGLSLSFFF